MKKSGMMFSYILLLLIAGGVDCAFSKTVFPASGTSGQLVVALNNTPTHFNPAVHSGVLTGIVGSQLFAGLFRVDADGTVRPYLAETWSFSDDRLTLSIKLRQNACFHDGVAVSAEDVIFSLQTVKRYHPFVTMLSALDRMVALDEHTVKLHLKHHHPALFHVLTAVLTPILPKHIYGDGQYIPTHPANSKVIGSGPFKLTDYRFGEEITLKAFEHFFLPDRPYLNTIIFKIYSSPKDHPFALENGEIQVVFFSPLLRYLSALAENSNLKISRKGYEAIGPMVWMGFNLQQEPFNDIRVRRAFAHAIDLNFITNYILGGPSTQLDGPIIRTSPFYAPPKNMIEYDIDKANHLLDEAGYKRDSQGKRMAVDITCPPNLAPLKHSFLTFLRHQLSRKIGVDLRIHEVAELSTWSKIISSRNFHITIDSVFSWYDPVIGVHRTYLSDNIRTDVTWSNTLAYSNNRVDKLLEEAGKEKDIEQRKRLYAEFQNVVREDLPMIWLGTMPYVTIFDKRLQGVNRSIWGALAPMDEFFWQINGQDP